MNKILLGIGIGVAASISLGSIGVAQELQEIVVTGKGEVGVKPAGKTASGVPIVDVSISYGVSYAGLDLASAVGAAEIEKRVNDAAKEACKEISAKRPLAQFTTSEAECAKAVSARSWTPLRSVRISDSELVTHGAPVVPVSDGLSGAGIDALRLQLRQRNPEGPIVPTSKHDDLSLAVLFRGQAGDRDRFASPQR